MTSASELPLRHRLLAILSLAATRGTNRVPIANFFEIFADLAAKHPDVFSGLQIERTAFYAYSRKLDGALQSLIGSGVDISNLQGIEVKDAAARHIVRRLKDSYGDSAIDSFDPIAEELANHHMIR